MMGTNDLILRNPTKILLVDDHLENLVSLSAILSNSEYNIITAQSGFQALSALLKNEFAVILLDVMMPDMDGYQLATLIKERERTRHVPIIFLTAIATDVNHIYKGYTSGAIDYLLKPLDPEIVKAKVASFVDIYRKDLRIRQQSEQIREMERKEQEAQMSLLKKESEAWYSTTLNSIGDAVIATDLQGMIRFMNPMAELLTGWSYAEAKEKPLEAVFKLVHEKTRSSSENPTIQVVKDGTIIELSDHFLLISKNGKEVVIEDSSAPIKTDRGGNIGFVFVFHDATEKKAEERRKALISKVSATLLSSLDYSENLEDVARLTVAEIADSCIIDILLPDSKLTSDLFVAHADSNREKLLLNHIKESSMGENFNLFIQPVLQNRRIRLFSDHSEISEVAVSSKTMKWISDLNVQSMICASISLRDNHLGYIIFSLEDSHRKFRFEDFPMVEELTNRIAIAVENSRLYEAAQKAIRLRDEFLSVASHELRTPITPLKLQFQTMRNLAEKKMLATYPADKMEKIFNVTDRQMERLIKLIEELLDVSRISIGRLKLEKQETDLAEVVREIVNQFSGEIHKVNCAIELNTKPVKGYWDKLRIEQVFINLLGNAMKYGAGKPIHITTETMGNKATLKVQDHGIGIVKSEQSRIFERFERAASAKHFAGLGLGLYICRQILEAHGGRIWVESEPGKGSTFTIELPIQAEGKKI